LQQKHTELKGSGGGATEHGKVTYIPSRNTNSDVSEAEEQHLGPLKAFRHIIIVTNLLKFLTTATEPITCKHCRLNGRRITSEELSFT
jgi:hypothetical protein